jgi:Fe-S cluster assembly protein SufD
MDTAHDKPAAKSMLAALDGSPPGESTPWLRSIRARAGQKTIDLGFPTTRDEEWKFTNVAPVLQLALEPARATREVKPQDIERFGFDLDCYRLVFMDGRYCANLSSPPPVNPNFHAGSLAEQLTANPSSLSKDLAAHAHFDDNYFAALNTACFHDGAFISVAAGKAADKPIHLLFIGATDKAGATSFPRTLVLAPQNAEVKIIESHVSLADAARLTVPVTELVLGPNAQVEHCKIQQESGSAYHVAFVQAVLAEDSRWTSHSIALGSRLARNQVQARFEGKGGEAILNGLYLGRGEQLIDHHTVVDHAQPLCESHEFYHGILADRSHGVFNGKIFVRQDAQKTNAKQTNRNLLLSDNAVIDTKPQLEIFADDVKCTHGATVGQLSEEAHFYLRARGIGEQSARRMLIQAFARDVVERISIEPVRTEMEEMLLHRFAPVEA